MPFDHENLRVYQEARAFSVMSICSARDFPPGYAFLRDQLARASSSILLNIAEGCGKFARMDKRRYYRSALGSAAECAAIYDLLIDLGLATESQRDDAKMRLDFIASMLTGLCKSMGGRT